MLPNFLLFSLLSGSLALASPLTRPEPVTKRQAAITISSCTQPGTVALTFDDGPFSYTDALLDTLAANNMKATFFLNGQNWGSIYTFTSTVQRMDKEGHQIGSHTWSHPYLTSLDAGGITAQMQQLETAFTSIIGKVPTYMRPPYFDYNSLVLDVLGGMGYKVVLVDNDTRDWELQANIDQAVANFENGLNAGARLVLSHDVHQNTVYGLVPRMVDIIRQRGLNAVTLGDCLGDAPGNWYRPGGSSPEDPTTPPVDPPPGGVISPDGTCGGTNGYHCPTNVCCSQHGWCGVEVGHCGAGCNPEFGVCN